MKYLVELIASTLIVVTWIAGIVLAHGFWQTAAAVCLPPYAWYLVLERALEMAGWV